MPIFVLILFLFFAVLCWDFFTLYGIEISKKYAIAVYTVDVKVCLHRNALWAG